MAAIWIAAALIAGVLGGWPVTAGILRLARSKPVRAMDAAESGGPDQPAGPAQPAAPAAPAQAAAPSSIAAEEDPTGPTPAPGTKVEVLRGGLLIGFLERAAVMVAIFSGQPVAIAYVVAIKGLGRYPELKDTPAASERFIIGTFASLLWAASVAALTKALLL
ncbi:hypothetical protein AAGW05_07345 [Arthrobacter sp. LAPM80]|uniref:hypothetical protein n=1 Tax=Arthrobacter sp. LAPM80 TaxID=3141788 RepID=UPI00398A7CF2